MSIFKIGIELASLRQPLRKALATAARLGAEGVEIDALAELKPSEMGATAVRQFRKLLDDLNLRAAALSFHTRHGYDEPSGLGRRVAATKAAMRLAYDLGAGVVVNHVGEIPNDEASPEWQTLVEVLTDLGAHGHRVGTTLAATTGGESGEAMARLLAALPEGFLGVDLDPGNLIANGFSPIDAAQALSRHVVYVHAHDGARDLARGQGLEVQLGRGTADFPALFGTLEDAGYRGWATIVRRQSNDPIAEIGEGVQFLRAIQAG